MKSNCVHDEVNGNVSNAESTMLGTHQNATMIDTAFKVSAIGATNGKVPDNYRPQSRKKERVVSTKLKTQMSDPRVNSQRQTLLQHLHPTAAQSIYYRAHTNNHHSNGDRQQVAHKRQYLPFKHVVFERRGVKVGRRIQTQLANVGLDAAQGWGFGHGGQYCSSRSKMGWVGELQ